MKTNIISRMVCKFFPLLCAVILPALMIISANAQTTIAGWDFNGYAGGGSSPQAPTTNSPNVTVTGLTRGSALGTAGSPAGNAWGTSVSVTNLSSATTAVASNSFATFSVKADSGYTLSLSNIAAYNVRRSGSGPTTGQWQYSTNGADFTDIGTSITWGATTTSGGNSQTAINLSGISALQSLPASATVTFRVVVWGATGTSGSWYLNNFQTNNDFILTGSVTASGPAINTNGSLTPFSTEAGTASAAQTFNATGVNLTQDITVTAPADFEVATDGSTYGATATITQTGGSASATVSVRIKSSATAGAKSGNIVLSSDGATSVNVPVAGTVIVPGAPILRLSTNSITGLNGTTGSPSAATNYSVTGTNLGSNPVTITSDSALLEVGTDGTNFASTLNLTPSGGTVSNAVFVRVVATNVVTNYTGLINHVSGSASNSLSVSGAITNATATLTVSTNALSGFTTTVNVPSASQAFTVTGSNLTTNVTVGASSGFEVASDGVTFGTNASITPLSGIANQEVSVRLAAGVVSGPRSGSVSVASAGATSRTVAVSGSVAVPNIPGLVYWDFTTNTPTSGTGGDYTAWTFGSLTLSNNNGTTTLFTNASVSSGYTNPFNVLASGTTNAGAAARTNAFDANTSTFFQVQVVVPSNTTTSITNISFGSRSTGTGPAAYSIRSSVDNFAADFATNSLGTNSTWAMYSAPISIALSNGTNTIRIYGYGSTATNASPSSVNWRIDDLTLALGTGTGPTPPSGLSYTPSSVSGVVGTAITNMVPVVTGTVTNYSIDPTLPAGLSIDPTTGLISGTPTAVAGSASYMVTASNAGGSTTANVTISVVSSYEGWATSYGLSGADALPTADPDKDGLNNNNEYAFGTNPTVSNATLLTATTSAGNMTVTWVERNSGFVYNVQSTVNLATTPFANDDVTVSAGPTDPSPPTGYTRKQFTVPASNNKFFRVRATPN